MSERHNPTEGKEFQAKTVEHEPTHHEKDVVENTEQHSPEKTRQSIEHITRKVEQHAVSGSERHTPAAEKRHHPVLVNNHLKDTAYNRTMIRVQKKLSLPNRYLSKAMHSRVLDKPSEVASKTIARPSGMLGGAFVAMIGTLLLFWAVNHYGYEYNYLAVGVLFVAGIFLGLLTEGFIKLLRR